MRLTVRLSMATVALAAAMLSYQSLMHLGELAGYGWLSPLYPVVVDAGAAASCAAWLYTRSRQPLVMTWCLLAVSVILNGTTHYLESTRTATSWLLVVAVAAVPPTVLGLTVHLAVDMRRPDPSLESWTGSTTPGSAARGAGDATPDAAPGTGLTVDMRRPGQDEREGVPAGSATSPSNQLRGAGDVTSDPKDSYVNSCDDRIANKWGLPGRLVTPRGNQPTGTSPIPDVSLGAANVSNVTDVAAVVGGEDQVNKLISSGVGRRKLAEALNITEHQARVMIEQRRNGHADVQA